LGSLKEEARTVRDSKLSKAKGVSKGIGQAVSVSKLNNPKILESLKE